MNFINKTLCITALFTIGSVFARNVPAKNPITPPNVQTPPALPPRPGAPALPPRPGAPALPPRSYKQLHDNILRMTSGSVFSGDKLNETFIQNTVAQAKAAGIGAEGLKFLLQTARDKFAPFGGNNESDLKLLTQINTQIDNAAQSI